MKTRNQERANFALEEIKGKDKKYLTYAKKLPALITTNGLIQTLAFLKSKKETEGVYESLNKWLKKRELVDQDEDSITCLAKSDFLTLRLATMEAMSLANWLKRMAEIKEEE